MLSTAILVTSLAFFTISSFNLLALLFYGAMFIWQARHHTLIAALPFFIVLLGGYFLGFSEHHTSVLWTTIVIALWLTWSRVSPIAPTRYDLIFQFILIAVLIEQLAWTGFATIYDTNNPFDGSVAAATFIIPQTGEHTVAGFNFHSISIQPYASRNVYFNQPTTYWPWKSSANTDSNLSETLAKHPDFILDGEGYYGDTNWANQILPRTPHWVRADTSVSAGYLQEHGYYETHRFCGRQPAHFGFSEQICEVIYQPLFIGR
jgi:hypothetical protein